MQVADIVRFYGSRVAVARALGISKSAITHWNRHGVPLLRQYQLQGLSGGQLTIDANKRDR